MLASLRMKLTRIYMQEKVVSSSFLIAACHKNSKFPKKFFKCQKKNEIIRYFSHDLLDGDVLFCCHRRLTGSLGPTCPR